MRSSSTDNTGEFISLLTRYQVLIRAYIVSLMPGSSNVSDVLQDVNLVLWEKRGSYKSGTNFKAWAFSVARYEVFNWRRRLEKEGKKFLSLELLDSFSEELAGSGESEDHRLDALKDCLGRLTDSDKDLVKHRYDSHQGLESYADSVGRTAASVRVSLYRIRNVLRQCIESKMVNGGAQ
ncbi:RNA polymerase sigma-70 factor, ECF subfamily [Rubritalea squalenifaciens DSM 18772]|uniref:RNA polymerase sigma-70 factor, ECF subfamily n=1 Tax=Rubritalea squalenifaciens DSM 18772 TaxID=1123071 RepID=A0A1M6IW86_9BACT|nr:RNA polymerase sigma-70 factor, ECF subfamily [Rubritalea squalenifaciens DSM 18772]